MFLTTTPLPSASRPRPKLRTATTTNTAAKNRKSDRKIWRPERVLRCISIEADRNAPSRAGQPQRQPYAAESAAHLQGVERTRSRSVGCHGTPKSTCRHEMRQSCWSGDTHTFPPSRPEERDEGSR